MIRGCIGKCIGAYRPDRRAINENILDVIGCIRGDRKGNIRTGDNIEEVQAKSYGNPLPTTTNDDTETGQLSLPAARIFETQLEFIKASPSPTLNSFDFTSAMAVVEDDQPIILSLDEAGPGLARAYNYEEGLVETPNSKKLIDGDADTQWTSLSASNLTPVTVMVVFVTPSGGADSRDLNAVILRDTNIKGLKLYVAGTTLFEGEITEDDVIIPFPPIATAAIQLEARTTKIPDQNKKIGEIYCGQMLLALPNFESYAPQRELFEAGSLRTLGGKLIAWRGRNKYASKWRITLADTDSKDATELIFRENPLITFWPEPKARPRELFDVGWKAETLPFSYSSVFKNAGHTIEAEMEEI